METSPRIAMVTGGASGIGRAITRALLGRGWVVPMCDRTPASLERAATSLGAGKRLLVWRADAAVEDDVKRWFSAVAERFGAPELLVNNAAVVFESPAPDTPTSAWDTTVDVNLRGALLYPRGVPD